MIIGIMQPYFFPYIGYWQLMKRVDRYVICDDVQFMKSSWIYRNRILIGGDVHYLNVPMVGASMTKRIDEVGVRADATWRRKTERTLYYAYKGAPCYAEVMPSISRMLAFETDSLRDYLTHLLLEMAQLLELPTEFFLSSKLHAGISGTGEGVPEREARIFALCRALEGDTYYNAPGGRALYHEDSFSRVGLRLRFVDPEPIRYPQLSETFVPNLSILDVLMNCGKAGTMELLDRCQVNREERTDDLL